MAPSRDCKIELMLMGILLKILMPRSHPRPSAPEGLEWEEGIRFVFCQVIPGLRTTRIRNSAVLVVLNPGGIVELPGRYLKYSDSHCQGNLISLVWGGAVSYFG